MKRNILFEYSTWAAGVLITGLILIGVIQHHAAMFDWLAPLAIPLIKYTDQQHVFFFRFVLSLFRKPAGVPSISEALIMATTTTTVTTTAPSELTAVEKLLEGAALASADAGFAYIEANIGTIIPASDLAIITPFLPVVTAVLKAIPASSIPSALQAVLNAIPGVKV